MTARVGQQGNKMACTPMCFGCKKTGFYSFLVILLYLSSCSVGVYTRENDVNEVETQSRRYLSSSKREKGSVFGSILSMFSSSHSNDKMMKNKKESSKENRISEKVTSSPTKRENPFNFVNISHQSADRVKKSTINTLGMWKIDLENSETWKLHNRFPSIDSIYSEDLAGAWRKQVDKSQILESIGDKDKRNQKSNMIVPGSFLFHMQNLPSLQQNPFIAVVWDGSESELHVQPWEFGHALGRLGGRKACVRWFSEVGRGLGCHAG